MTSPTAITDRVGNSPIESGRIIDRAQRNRAIDWSPDGRWILSTSHRDHPDNYTNVYVMRPDGSGIRRLSNDVGYAPAWSPDGNHIVFSTPGLSIMDPDGGDARAFPSLGVGETALADWTDGSG